MDLDSVAEIVLGPHGHDDYWDNALLAGFSKGQSHNGEISIRIGANNEPKDTKMQPVCRRATMSQSVQR